MKRLLVLLVVVGFVGGGCEKQKETASDARLYHAVVNTRVIANDARFITPS